MESEMVKILGKEDCIDRRYYDALVDAAATDISSMAISSGLFPKIRMFLTRRLGSAPENPTKRTVHRLM